MDDALGRLLAYMHQSGQLTPALLAQIMGTSTPAAPSAASSNMPSAQSLLPTPFPTSSSTSAPTLSPQVASVAPSPISRITPPPITSTPSSTAGGSLGTLPRPPSSSISAPAAPYNSMSMLQSVAQGSSSMPQPALGGFASGQRSGIANLVSQRLNSSRSDRARRDHANAVLPRKRSKATSKPSLTETYREPRVEDCIDTAALPTGESTPVINLSLQGRLSFPGRSTRIEYRLPNYMVHYTRQEESFFNLNDRLGLNIELPLLPLNTPISTVLSHVTEAIRKRDLVLLHDLGGQSSFLSAASLLPVELLSYTNMGHSTSASQTPRLRAAVIRADAIVNDLLTTYKQEFVVKSAITHRRFLVVNFAVKDRHQDPTSIRTSLAEFGLGTELLKREHKCLSIRTYATFREDHDALLPEGYQNLFLEEGPDGQSVDVLCDEQGCVLIDEDNVMDQDDERTVQQALISPSLPAARPLSANASNSVTSTSMPTTSGQSNHHRHATPLDTETLGHVASLPYGGGILWSTPWTPPTQRRSTFYNFNRTDTFYAENKKAYLRTNGEEIDAPSLHLAAPNVQLLTNLFIAEVRAANEANDFTILLSPDRHFMIEGVTSGPGVESEVIHAAFKQYTDEPAQWFAPSTGGFSTIATLATTVNEHVSRRRLDDLEDLGSLVALNLIYGFPPIPLNPLLLEYLLNEGDINSLSKDKVLRYFPDLANLLSAWVDMSHTDSLDGNLFGPHFATYHDLQISTLSQRDAETHRVMAFRMLHNSVIGKLGIDCQELQAFLKGFRLPVPGGLTFPEIARSYLYGSGAFIAKAYNFIETFEDLSSNLEINFDHLNPADESRLINALDSAPQPYTRKTFEFILKDFLEATGIPCPTLFDSQVKGRISPIVPLSEAETPTFRLRSFTWAIGGAPFLRAGTQTTMEIILVSDDDRAYICRRSDEPRRAEFLLNGVCSFKTCFQEMRIPVSHLIRLLGGVYTTETEFKNVRDAIHFWLFRQILEAIGSHTFV
ncbi:hypothetical protein BT96DRAFT_999572 [Gymnopus androsaceus JB14]|uniref:HECT domain-containing protein n=1 Tax=Gymnopus androsaceus JB14 TaxID=1447944 RepID=A0A6A4H6A8_9AGAR|nr:hypothetical protein BT96DRAFT_999572 [Gymnopus androsaceus JB14]